MINGLSEGGGQRPGPIDAAGIDCATAVARGKFDITTNPVTARSRPAPGWLLLALLAAAITVFYRLGALPLITPDEGRNAEVAREMKESGSWLVPTYNGLPYLDKPAFYFKAVGLALAAVGDNETGARLPSALSALGLLVVVGLFTHRVCGPRPAALAILVVTTLPLFISQARLVIFDITLAFFVCSSIVAGYLAESMEGAARRRWYCLGAAAAGFATLVKGPVGFAVPLIVLIAHHAVERRWKAILRLFHPLNFVVIFAVVLPWFLGVTRAHPDFPHYGLIEETFKRFTTPQFRRTQPFYFYLVVLPATFFPWSLLLPGAGVAALRRWRELPPVSRFCIVWCVAVVVFFSLSQSKLPAYILSVVLPFGVLAAQLLEAALRNPAGHAARIVRGATLILAIIFALLAAGLIIVAPQTGILSTPLTIPKVDLNQFLPAFIPVLIMLAAVAVAATVSRIRRDPRGFVFSFALFPLLLVLLGSGIFSPIFEGRSLRKSSAQLAGLPPGTPLVFLRCYPNGLPFYLRRTGTLVTTDGGELTSNYVQYALKRAPKWPEGVISIDEFDTWIAAQRGPVYLIVRDNDRDRFQTLARERGGPVDTLGRRYQGVLLAPARGS
jgi:4-amino-4-deoxy-L-arabinose transferase-like glycosyltransferase